MDNKLYSVQYMRGLAAVLVVIAHAAAHPLSGEFYVLHRLGQLGVVMFFVISGFIMVAISGEGRFAPLEFLKRRIVRIVPLYWIFTTLAAVLALLLPGLFRTTVFTWPHYLQSLLFIPHEAPGRGGTSPLLSLGWTLNYEAWFYLCFAALALLAARGRVLALTLLFVAFHIVGVLISPQDPLLVVYTNQAPLAFCVGAWIGLAAIKGRIAALPRGLTPVAIGIGSAGLVVAFVLDRGIVDSYPVFISLVLFAAALLLLGLRHEKTIPRSRRLEQIGDASYAIYLVHMFAVGAAVAVGFRLLAVDSVPGYLAVVTIAVAGAVGAGIVVHETIEKPLLRLMRGPRRPRPAVLANSAA